MIWIFTSSRPSARVQPLVKLGSSVALLSCAFLASNPEAAAAGHVLTWADGEGGGGADGFRSVAMDPTGRTLAAGFVTHVNSVDLYVARYRSNGVLESAWRTNGGGIDIAHDIAVDGFLQYYVVGSFDDVFDPGGIEIPSLGGSDVLVAKRGYYTTTNWVAGWGGPMDDGGASIDVTAEGDVVVTGTYEGIADFGGVPLVPFGSTDVFVAKYDTNGNHLWSQRAGGSDVDVAHAVAVDSAGDIIVTGHFAGSASFGGATFTSMGADDIFLAKYDGTTGAHVWSLQEGGDMTDHALGLDVDSADRIVISGEFSGTAQIGDSTFVSGGLSDIFVSQYDSAGTPTWAVRMGGPGSDTGEDVSIDPEDRPLVAGTYEDVANFLGEVRFSNGGSDFFLTAFDSDGTLLCVLANGSSMDDHGLGVAALSPTEMSIVGDFHDSFTLEGGEITLTSEGDADAFVLRSGAPSADAPWAHSERLPGIRIKSVYPNPIQDSSAMIEFSLPNETGARIDVLDSTGRLIRALACRITEGGIGTAVWNGRSASGRPISPGVYWIRITSSADEQTEAARSVVVVR